MRSAIIFICLLVFSTSQAQVYINSQSGTVPANLSSPSVLLEFSNNANKGLILPWTNGDVANPSNGTIIFNTVSKKVKVYINDRWIDYSNEASSNNAIDTSLQNNPAYTEKPNTTTIIGSNASTAKGILVLESSNKAMVLPKVASPHLNIINPSPGMIVFDTVKELLCIYNGTQWSFIQKDQ
ncbi:hypothetical protein ACKW6Q_18685 [Chryseobacterium kwangjuense]|uniref:Uncharacterized protein n=1 Tax=Chryseobacterium kwangjuense TaxID=267125 RepID=A0ABW9K9G3_9FLAO